MTGTSNVTNNTQYYVNIYPKDDSSSYLKSPKARRYHDAAWPNLSIVWNIVPDARYVFELWETYGRDSVASSGTYTGAQLLANLGKKHSYPMGEYGNVDLLVTRTAEAQAQYETELSVANTTLWTLAQYNDGYTLESVDTPGLYLSSGGPGHLTVRSLAASENANATWYIYLSGTQYAFVNLQTLEVPPPPFVRRAHRRKWGCDAM